MYVSSDSWVGIGGIGNKNGTLLAVVVVIFIGGAGFWLASGNNSNNNPEKERLPESLDKYYKG